MTGEYKQSIMKTYIAHNDYEPLEHIFYHSPMKNVFYVNLKLKHRNIYQWLLSVTGFYRYFPSFYMSKETIQNLKQIESGNKIIIVDHKHLTHLKVVNYLLNRDVERHLFIWTPLSQIYQKRSHKRICSRTSKIGEMFSLSGFDIGDRCYFSDLKIKNQFFYEPTEEEIKLGEQDIACDCYFLGHDKGRQEELLKIKSIIEKQSLTCEFNIMRNHGNYCSYAENIEHIKHCRCIVDFTKGQNGLSLRPLEALFYRKKLMTNNPTIIQQSFYNPQNIFVIGMDDWNKLYDFIKSPFVEIPQTVMEQYLFTTWVNSY